MIFASVVTYRSDRNELDSLFRSVLNASIDRIYIIDNSPTDELKDYAELSPKIEYLFGHGNVGYGSAHNMAIQTSMDIGARYHIILNPDIYFEPGVIEELTRYMDANPDVGQVMPRVVYPDGQLQYLCKLLPSPMDLIGRRFVPFKSYTAKRNYNFEMRASRYDEVMEAPFLSGCFMFLRVEALSEVGGFSDRYFMYCEDLDLCRRIGEKYKTVYYPGVTVVHAHKKESFKSNKMLFVHMKSAILYFNRWGWIFDKYRSQINKMAKSQYLNKTPD